MSSEESLGNLKRSSRWDNLERVLFEHNSGYALKRVEIVERILAQIHLEA